MSNSNARNTWDDEESIYDLIPRQAAQREKRQRYVSKYNGMVKDERVRQIDTKNAGLMGPPNAESLAGSRISQLAQKQNSQVTERRARRADDTSRRPPVPRRDNWAKTAQPTDTNFITKNAVTNIKATPKQPEIKMVDTPSGTTQKLETSGLVPHFVKKKEYGQVPKYLNNRKQQWQKITEKYHQEIEESYKNSPIQELSEEERAKVLDGLKQNWDEVYKQYNSMSLVVDTQPKQHRKKALEAELDQLEKDIEMLQRPKKIYVTQNAM